MRTSRSSRLAVLLLAVLLVCGCSQRVDPRIQEAYDLIVVGKMDEAVALANAILTQDPENAPALNILGLALYRAGDPEGAVVQYQRALDVDPDYAEVHFNLGNAYQRLQRIQDAEAAFAAAVRHQPKFVLAHFNLGHIYSRTNRPDQAIRQLQAATKHDDRFFPGFFLLGELLYEQGDFAGAVTSISRGLELDPTAMDQRVLLGNAYLQRGGPDALPLAEEQFRAAAGIDPGYVEALYSLGMALAAQGRDQEAAQWFRNALPLARERSENGPIAQQIEAFFVRTGIPVEAPADAASPDAAGPAATPGDSLPGTAG